VTEFSKTFLVFYKWPNLTDVQGIVHSTVCLVTFVCCEPTLSYIYHFLVLLVQVYNMLNLVLSGFDTPCDVHTSIINFYATASHVDLRAAGGRHARDPHGGHL
jgi:hypothetical protein